MNSTFAPEDIAAFEHATWSRCADGYRAGFEALTAQAVGELLDAAAVASGQQVLDVGTGPGTVVAAALGRGATAVGIDFSDAMLAEARRAVPGAEFHNALADALPFKDNTYDAVVANGVLHHLGDPDRALREANRVLVPGGRMACTVWAAPDTLEAFGLFFAAVEEHAGAADLPHGPLFGVTDPDVLEPLFRAAGFRDIAFEVIATTWRMGSIDPLLRAFGAWAQLDTFPTERRDAIEQTVRSSCTRYEVGDGLEIPNPMLLISAAKPA